MTTELTIDDILASLRELKEQLGGDTVVAIQSKGCCSHGHPAYACEKGKNEDNGTVVIRG